jgi:hypothetical protein
MIARRGIGIVMIVALVGLFPGLSAAAQEDPATLDPATVDLRLTIPSNADIPPQFIATVRDAQGNAIPGMIVEFSRELEFLGTKRMALLGSGSTDIGGAARLVVLPRQEHATVIATVVGSDVSARMDATFPEDRVDTFFDPEHEHGLLTPVRSVMPYLISALVVLLWIFVIALVVSTVRRIRHLGDKEGGQIA